MPNNRAHLTELRERLQASGAQVPPDAASFHREHAALLAEVEDALSWRGLLGLGQSAAALAPRVDDLATRGQALHLLFGRIDQLAGTLTTALHTLGRIKHRALGAPGGIPAAVERLRVALSRLGRLVRTDDDLMVDQRRCDEAADASIRLTEALTLWLSAEETLARVRGSTRTAALEAALPELGERLCREGPTPQWLAELKGLLDPLDQLAHRAQPREIKETEKIIKDLPRWARVLGEDGDAGAALSTRFMAKRKDWPGEDDRTFADLFDQARCLEQALLDKAAVIRGEGIAALDASYALFTELVGADPRIAEQLRDLQAETPDDPRDFEDWCEQLRDAKAAFQARVKRSESELLAQLNRSLADCRQRLDTLGLIPRLDEKDARFAYLQATFESLNRAGEEIDPLGLLADVQRARVLLSDLDALEQAIRAENAGLAEERAALERRADWLTERAARLGIALPATPPDPVPLANDASLQTNLEQVRRQLTDRARQLAQAEDHFAQRCRDAIDADHRRTDQVLRVLAPERIRQCGLDLSPIGAATAALGEIADRVERLRARRAGVEALLPGEEQARMDRAAELQQALVQIPAEQLGHNDRGERDQMLRQLERWDPNRLADPVERIDALAELCENAEHLRKRFVVAAQRLQERSEALLERLRRFNGLSLQGYCPDLYLRVEALVHPPADTRWPRGAQAWQLREAERLLGLLERQAQRLAAREIAGHVQVLQRHAQRAQDTAAQAVVDEVLALPPEQPPPARLRRRLAELAESHRIRTEIAGLLSMVVGLQPDRGTSSSDPQPPVNIKSSDEHRFSLKDGGRGQGASRVSIRSRTSADMV